MDEYISANIIPHISGYMKTTSKIIIHPFVLKSHDMITLHTLKCIPHIFRKSKQIKIEELCFRDTYYRNIDNNKYYVTSKRTPVDVKSKSFIEIVTDTKISDECFPLLSKYDSVKNYSYYEYKMDDNIYFKLIDTSGKKYISVEIINISALTDNNINKICQYLNKISDDCK